MLRGTSRVEIPHGLLLELIQSGDAQEATRESPALATSRPTAISRRPARLQLRFQTPGASLASCLILFADTTEQV